jgi:Tfp pilus assembly protein PilE
LQAAQEKFYLQNNAYAANVTTLGLATASAQGLYSISITAGVNKQSYTATAAPISGKGQQDDTKCQSFTITDTGVRNVTGPDGAAVCWR